MRTASLRTARWLAAFALLATSPAIAEPVVIHEIAWMGTEDSSASEWLELRNVTAGDVALDGWRVESTDLSFSVPLSGTVSAGGFHLLERGDDLAVPCVPADLVYDTGEVLPNAGFVLRLLDDAGRVVRVLEVDDVVRDEVDRRARHPHGLREPAAERLPPRGVAADAHIRREECHQRLHVARVEGEGVAVRELADLRERLQAVEALLAIAGLPGSEAGHAAFSVGGCAFEATIGAPGR